MLDSQNPVVFFANAIGDHLLTLPALRALVKLFPQKITLIGNPYFQHFLPEFEQDITYKSQINWDGKQWTFDLESVANNLEKCDFLIWLSTWYPNDPESLLKFIAPQHTVGFCPSFEINIPFDFSQHAAESTFEVPRRLSANLCLEDFAYPPIFGSANQKRARIIRNSVSESMKVLVVHGDTKPEKMWPAERFGILLDLFLQRHPDFVVFVVGNHKLQLNIKGYGERIFFYNNRLALATSLALVGEADLFLGVDSCMLHAADFFRVPGVGLFGATSVEHWGFRFAHHRHVCSENMNKIKVDKVLEALETILDTSELTALSAV